MLLIGLYLKNKNKTKKQKTGKKKQILLSEPGLEFNCVCIFFFNWKCRTKWLKLWTHPLAAVLVAHVGSLFWFITKLCDFPGMWIPARAIAEKNKQTNKQKNKNKNKKKKKKKNKQTNKQTNKTLAILSSSVSPPSFFFPWKNIWVYSYMHANTQHQWRKKRQKWFQSKKH